MSEREQEVYNLLINARDIARDANDDLAISIDGIIQAMESRAESQRTGEP